MALFEEGSRRIDSTTNENFIDVSLQSHVVGMGQEVAHESPEQIEQQDETHEYPDQIEH